MRIQVFLKPSSTHIPAVPPEHRNPTQDFMLDSYKDPAGMLLPKDSASNTLDGRQ